MKNVEEWREVIGYEGKYWISSTGRLKYMDSKSHAVKFSKASFSVKDGYVFATLHKDGVSKTTTIHRMVALCFVENPENKPQVNHIDGIKTHNYPDNLEWCTQSENLLHAHKHNLKPATWEGKKGKGHPTSRPILQFDQSGNYIARFNGTREASRNTGVNCGNLCACARGELSLAGKFKWKYE